MKLQHFIHLLEVKNKQKINKKTIKIDMSPALKAFKRLLDKQSQSIFGTKNKKYTKGLKVSYDNSTKMITVSNPSNPLDEYFKDKEQTDILMTQIQFILDSAVQSDLGLTSEEYVINVLPGVDNILLNVQSTNKKNKKNNSSHNVDTPTPQAPIVDTPTPQAPIVDTPTPPEPTSNVPLEL